MANKLIAILIDGDNVQPSVVEKLLGEVSTKHGNPIIKRVFLNNASIKKWESQINRHSLRPVWVPNKTSRKNAADIELVIDAMELLYERQDLTAFCIVSSDSDFTGLAKRLTAKDKKVLGVGEGKTPDSFVKACNPFIYIEDLQEIDTHSKNPLALFGESDDQAFDGKQSFDKLFIQAYEIKSQNTDGWIPLLDLKEEMQRLNPEFQKSEFQNTRILAEKVKDLAQKYPAQILEVDELLDTKPVTHRINITDCDMFKFVEAYIHAPVKGTDGWVLLSVIGNELRKYPAYENGFTYRGIRRLSRVVNIMAQEYDGILEIHEEPDGSSVTHLIRILL